MLVFRSDDVIEVTARLVVVALPTTVKPLVNVEDAARSPPLKVRSVDVPLLGNKYPMVLAMIPVVELYAIPAPALSDVDEILLLKTLQSAEVSAPETVAEEFGRLKVVC